MPAPTLKELRDMHEDDLVSAHDYVADSTEPALNYYLSELARRDQSRQTIQMLKYTHWIFIMTGIVTIATIINVIIAFN